MEMTMDEAGRVPIPKEVQATLGLTPGMKLALETGNGAMTIKPLENGGASPITDKPNSEKSGLVWEGNVLVYHGEWRPTVDDVNHLIQSLDEERDRKIWNPEG